ncbi:MAG: tyrosine-type recombinase/integrase [Solirubrobacterales bacterium]
MSAHRSLRLRVRRRLAGPGPAVHRYPSNACRGARGETRTRGQRRAGRILLPSRITLHEYAREWIERYQGTGRRGFREETREGYRWNLERFALAYFPPGLRLTELSPRMVAEFIGWVARKEKQGGGKLSDSGVRNAFKPLSVCLATARREGLIRHNPASDAVLPHRPPVDDDEQRARPFPRIEVDGEGVETMELAVALVHPEHRLMFELLAATGVRRSELIAFEGRHLRLAGPRPFVSVRQRMRRRKGEGLVGGPLKSRYARRDLPIPVDLADRLSELGIRDDFPVFTTRNGRPPDNLYDRVLKPACEEAGVGWAGFHTFRHTVALRLFAAGRNAVQVLRWLGHHSPSFTLDTYVHVLDADLGEPLHLSAVDRLSLPAGRELPRPPLSAAVPSAA